MLAIDFKEFYGSLCADIDSAWEIDYQDLNDMAYDLDFDNQKIIIHSFGLSFSALMGSPYFKPQIELATIEALRMTRHMEWLNGAIEHYDADHIILMGRICAADIMAHKIHYAWCEKTDNDNPNPWKHLLCGDATDVAVAYETLMEKLYAQGLREDVIEQKSMAMAFNQWFACANRLQTCDHETLNMMDDLIAEGTEFFTKPLCVKMVEGLTEQSGTNQSYLDHHMHHDVLQNPYYQLMHDTINKAHFTQVKSDMNRYHVGGIVFQDATLAERFISH